MVEKAKHTYIMYLYNRRAFILIVNHVSKEKKPESEKQKKKAKLFIAFLKEDDEEY